MHAIAHDSNYTDAFKGQAMALEPRYCDKKKDVDCVAKPEDTSKEVLVICKICYNGSEDEPLLSPCNCSGSIKYVHQSCLMKWLKARKPVCELCNYKYVILKKAKPYDIVSIKTLQFHSFFKVRSRRV